MDDNILGWWPPHLATTQNASEPTSENVKIKNFLGGACPQTPLVCRASTKHGFPPPSLKSCMKPCKLLAFEEAPLSVPYLMSGCSTPMLLQIVNLSSLRLAPQCFAFRLIIYLEDFAQQYGKCGACSGPPQLETATALSEPRQLRPYMVLCNVQNFQLFSILTFKLQ